MFTVIFLILFYHICYKIWKDNFKIQNKPPGPFKIPFIGNLHNVFLTGEKLPYKAFHKLGLQYGPIISLKLGSIDGILLTSHEDMINILSREECLDRLPSLLVEDRNLQDELGIAMSNGEKWRKMRQFSVKTLRQFGFGRKSTMEQVIREEVLELVERTKLKLLETNGILRMDMFFNLSVLNVVWSMVAGQRYDHDDLRLKRLLETNRKSLETVTFAPDISIAFPFIRKWFPGFTNKEKLKHLFGEFHQFIREMKAEHESHEDYAQNPNSFVEVFLSKMDSESDILESEKFFTESNFIVTILDLFQTSGDSVSGTLSFAILFMILYPGVQAKVREEIQNVIPAGENVSLEHKSKMPYTQAVIHEILRFSHSSPLHIPRRAKEDFQYKGFLFQKGLAVYANYYSVTVSKEIGQDPEVFNPNRFLDLDGQLCNLQKHSPFGFGKRNCMGESIASPAIFMYFVMLLKYFEFSKVPGESVPTMDPLPSVALTPQPFNVKVTVRE